MAETTLGTLHGEPVNLTYDGDVLSWTTVSELPGGKKIPNESTFTPSTAHHLGPHGRSQRPAVVRIDTVERKRLAKGPTSVGKTGSFSSSSILFLVKRPGSEPGYTIYSTLLLPSSDPAAAVPAIELQITDVDNPPADFIARHLFQGLPAYLRLIPEDIHIIISSGSGDGTAAAFFEDTLMPLLEGACLDHHCYQMLFVNSRSCVNNLAKNELKPKACKGVKQTVILLSGDGGVGDLLNGLAGAERISTYVRPTIIPFPLGTGNALFHSLHKLSPPSISPLHTGVVSLLAGSVHPLPHFVAEFSGGAGLILPSQFPLAVDERPLPGSTHNYSRLGTDEGALESPQVYGAMVVSYGFHSTLVAESDTYELRKHGDKRFKMIADELLKDPHRYKARVTMTHMLTDEEVKAVAGEGKTVVKSPHGPIYPDKEEHIQRTHHSYVLCSLVSNLEKGFTISPASRPLDGKLRMVHFDSDSGKEIMDIMTAAYDGGKHVDMPVVGYQEVESVKIDFQEEQRHWLRVCVDGAIVRVQKNGWMKVTNGKKGQEVLDVVV